MARAFLCLVALQLAMAGGASASDFWDEVRAPGLGSYRSAVDRARAALVQGRHAQALEAAEAALAHIDHLPEAHVLRGNALAAQGNHQLAVEAYENALRLDPAAVDLPADGARAAQMAATSGAYVLAARILERILEPMEAGAERRQLHALQGDVLQMLGPERLHDAILAYRRARRGGNEAELRAGLGMALALLRSGEPGDGLQVARGVIGGHRIETLVARLPLTRGERAARLAMGLAAVGDESGARSAWARAAASEGPWQQQARRSARPRRSRP